MTSPVIDDFCVEDLNDGIYSLKTTEMSSACSVDNVSELEELVSREYKNICSTLCLDDDGDRLLLKAKCLAHVQLLGAFFHNYQKYLYKSYDHEMAKHLYADWSRLGIAFNVIANVQNSRLDDG